MRARVPIWVDGSLTYAPQPDDANGALCEAVATHPQGLPRGPASAAGRERDGLEALVSGKDEGHCADPVVQGIGPALQSRIERNMRYPYSHWVLPISSMTDSSFKTTGDTESEGWKGPYRFSSHFADGKTETRKGNLCEVTQPGQSSRLQTQDVGFQNQYSQWSREATGPPLLPWVNRGIEPVLSHLQ